METSEQIKNRLFKEYVANLKFDIKTNKKLLADETWASDGSEYHLHCRLQLKEEIEFNQKLLDYITKIKSPKNLKHL